MCIMKDRLHDENRDAVELSGGGCEEVYCIVFCIAYCILY